MEKNDHGSSSSRPTSDDSPIITGREAAIFVLVVFSMVTGSVLLVYLLPPGEMKDWVVSVLRPAFKVALPLMPALPVILISIRMNKRHAGKRE